MIRIQEAQEIVRKYHSGDFHFKNTYFMAVYDIEKAIASGEYVLCKVDDLISNKTHEVYSKNGTPYTVVTVQDLKEACK